MLTICIPVYNFDVTVLVKDLEKQLLDTNHLFEILLMDDASEDFFCNINGVLQSENIRYIQLSENIGRARIRNRLMEAAKFPYLIFMDCDSKVSSENYIFDYLRMCEPMTVCYGGRIYETYNEKPEELLRWKYGVERESTNAEIRKRNPNYSFCTNNFLIHKDVFQYVKFNENLKGYGHEDTLFGLELLANNIIIKHINNPLVHIGIEANYVFLEKTENGVLNLLRVDKLLKEQYPDYENYSKLVAIYNKLKKLRLRRACAAILGIAKPVMRNNLLGKNPSLFVFDLYKLGLLCSLKYKSN